MRQGNLFVHLVQVTGSTYPEIFLELSISRRYVQKFEKKNRKVQFVSELTIFLNL